MIETSVGRWAAVAAATMALFAEPTAAQEQPCYEVSVFAGRGVGDGGAPTDAVFNSPRSVVFDASGNLYVADAGNARVRRLEAGSLTVSTVAGNGAPGQGVDGAPATGTSLKEPSGLAFDAQGTLYIVDTGAHTVWKVGTDGILRRVAGSGTATGSLDGDNPGQGGNDPTDDLNDGQQAVFATLNRPVRAVVDGQGNLLVSDILNNRIRRVDAATGRISSIATAAEGLSEPVGLALAPNGDLYVANRGRNQILRISGSTVSVVVNQSGARGPAGGAVGTSVPALESMLNAAADVAVDPASGVLYIGDTESNWILKVDPNGMLSRLTGVNGIFGYRDGPAIFTQFRRPGVTVGPDGNLFIPDADNNRIRKYDIAADNTSTLAGGDNLPGDGGPATAALLNRPTGIAVDGGGNVYVSEHDSHRVRRIDPAGGIATIVNERGLNGSPGPDGTGARDSALGKPTGVAVDAAGNILIADAESEVVGASRILLVDPAGVLRFFAGNGTPGFGGDGGLAPNALLNTPLRMALGPDGATYIADFNNNRIRRVAGDGTISTFAGPETGTSLNQPSGLAFDGGGNLYVADFAANRVVRLDQNAGLTAIAGGGAPGSGGDGGPASAARFAGPTDVIVAADGALLVVDQNNNKIRRIAPGEDGTISGASMITTLIGDGRAAFRDGPADRASLLIPTDIELLGDRLLIADRGNQLVRVAAPGSGCGQGGGGCTIAADCDDGDACTTDTCTAEGQCRHDPVQTEECRPSCASAPDGCIPGGGGVRTDCMAELFVRAPLTTRNGRPAPVVRCKDGDAACDLDEVAGQCTFGVAWCLNVADGRIPCTSTGVGQQIVTGPAQATLLNALVEIAPQNASQAGRAVVFAPAMTEESCTTLKSVTVGLRRNGRRPGKLKIRGTAVSAGAPRRRDVDNVRLICLP